MKSAYVYTILVLVLVAFAGFLGYRHFKKSEEIKAHRADTFQRLTERARHSPRVGMADMGRALKRYYDTHKRYPDTLRDLHPGFIASLPFIEEVDWSYRPQGNDFVLSKKVESGGRTLTASIDGSLKTTIDTAVLVAAAATAAAPAAGGGSGAGGSAAQRSLLQAALLAVPEVPDFEPRAVAGAVPAKPRLGEARKVSLEPDEPLSPFAARVSRNYLVWRDRAGNIGYGNVQYPLEDRISIVFGDQWLRIERQSPRAGAASSDDGAAAAEGERVGGGVGSPERAAGRFGGGYLAWKDKNGAVGFGNVQYPDPKLVAFIYVDGGWEAFGDSVTQ